MCKTTPPGKKTKQKNYTLAAASGFLQTDYTHQIQLYTVVRCHGCRIYRAGQEEMRKKICPDTKCRENQ